MRNRTKVSGAQSPCLLSRAKHTDRARAERVVRWYGGFPNSLEEEGSSPHEEGQHFCLDTTSSVSQFCFPEELKGNLAAGMWMLWELSSIGRVSWARGTKTWIFRLFCVKNCIFSDMINRITKINIINF